MIEMSKSPFFILLFLFASVPSNMLGWRSVSHEQMAHSQLLVTDNSSMLEAQTNSTSTSIDNSNSSFNQAYTLFAEGKYEEAITFYDKVLAINPNLLLLCSIRVLHSLI
jgi:tetratricopeptide (TPR) repeat protein